MASSNGCVERVNRSITELLRAVTEDDPRAWDMNLYKTVISYNTT